jgi:hypothetical protein
MTRKATGNQMPVGKRTGKEGKQRNMPKPEKAPVDAPTASPYPLSPQC